MDRTLWKRPALATALLLSIPLFMTLLDQGRPAGEGWRWGPGDFLVMALLLMSAGLALEWLAQRSMARMQRWLIGLVVLLLMIAVWSELAVDAVSKGLRALFG